MGTCQNQDLPAHSHIPVKLQVFVFTPFNKKIHVFISTHVKTHTVHTVHNCVRELFTILFYMSLSKVALSKIKIYVFMSNILHTYTCFKYPSQKLPCLKKQNIYIHVVNSPIKHIIYICCIYPCQKLPCLK